MNPAFDAFLRSWPFNPLLVLSLALSAAIYFRGWRELCRRAPSRWNGGHLAAFLGGMTAVFLALGSPIEVFSSMALSIHMVQHMLLLMVAPPLIWLGTPNLVFLRGLPDSVRRYWIAPLLRARGLQRFFGRLTHPLVALPLFVGTIWLWHAPVIYEWALRSDVGHYFEHTSFLAAALLFWFPVIRPEPSRPGWSHWLLIPYLLIADVQNTLLAALLTFANRPIYRYYVEVPPLPGLSPLGDQAAAGVIMWVPGSVAFLVPLFAIGVRLLYPTRTQSRRATEISRIAIESRESTTSRAARAPGLNTVRRPEHPAAGPFSAVAARAAGIAIAAGHRGSNSDHRWIAWATDCRGQPGRRVAVDSLARIAHPGTARGGQCLLHGLSLHVATTAGRALAGTWTRLAACAAYEMVGGRAYRDLSLGLRNLFLMEQPAVDGLDRHRLLRHGLRRRRSVSRRHLLQIRLSHRPI